MKSLYCCGDEHVNGIVDYEETNTFLAKLSLTAWNQWSNLSSSWKQETADKKKI